MNSGRIAYNKTRQTLLFLLITTIYCLSVEIALAQTDSTFSVVRNGQEAKFPFLKLAKPEHFKTVASPALPLYGFTKTQYNRIKGLLTHFAQMENEYRLLLVNHHEKDSLFAVKEKALAESVKLEQQRAANFQASYNTLLGVNAQLNDQVKNAEQLAIQEHRKRKLNSILLGILVFSTGVAIGVTVR